MLSTQNGANFAKVSLFRMIGFNQAACRETGGTVDDLDLASRLLFIE